MPGRVEYDDFAEIYQVWTGSAPVTERNLPFYVEEYLQAEEPVVELGVGDGRIALEAARQGRAIVGVDSSAGMLDLCRLRAEAAGVAPLLTLVQADMRDFVLAEPAQLITIPFHTIGHMVTMADKRACLEQIYGQLAPGGRLIFDHFVFDPEAARRYSGTLLRDEFVDEATGHEMLLWVTTRYDVEAQFIRIVAYTDELDEDSVVLRRKYRRLSFSWLHPRQSRDLLEAAGFEIEALYGDFDRSPFAEGSPEQIWLARRGN